MVKVYTYTKGDKGIDSTTSEITVLIGEAGETITLDNPLVTDEERAVVLGTWVGNYLKNIRTLKSTVRDDVRLDALDIVSN